MKGLISKSHSPHFNLALEEYLFDTRREDDLLMLYINEPSVIVGRSQNVFEEVYVKRCQADRVPVVRRMTGGGAVFHDTGNLNFCFMTDYEPGSFASYDDFLRPVIAMLQEAGMPVEKRNHSDLACGGCKISGNAQTVRKGRILHHGTLLFDADLNRLYRYLRQDSGRCQSKSVKSVRSQVANLSGCGTSPMSAQAFAQRFLSAFCGEQEQIVLTEQDMEAVLDLQRDKYETWWWNFGRSPAFEAMDQVSFQGREMMIRSHVQGGIVKAACLETPVIGEDIALEAAIQQRLGRFTGRRYEETLAAEIFQEGDRDGTDLYAQAQ